MKKFLKKAQVNRVGKKPGNTWNLTTQAKKFEKL